MAGEITGFTVFWTIILFSFFCIGLGLTIHSFVRKQWGGNAKSNWKLVFCTAMTWLSGSFIGLITYIFVLIYGWSEGNISEYSFWLLTTIYTVSLFLSIFLWIKRLQAVFEESVFALNLHLLKFLKGTYFILVILGFVTLILFFAIDNSIILWTLSGLWTLLFAVELTILQYVFILKLVKLRVMAESTLKTSATHDDRNNQQLRMIHKIWSLQVKLTILATSTIISTVLALIVSFNVDVYYDLVPFGIDSFIGFLCIYCALKQHNEIFKKICVVCIKGCDICCQHQSIDTELATQIEIHSQTSGHTQQLTQTFNVTKDATASNEATSRNSSNEQRSEAKVKNYSQTSHIPQPSAQSTTNYNNKSDNDKSDNDKSVNDDTAIEITENNESK